MSEFFKKIVVVFILILLFLSFINSFKNIQNIDNFAYVVAIGLDKGINNTLKITFQTLSPTESGSSSGSESSGSDSSSSSNSSSVINASIECASINSGIQLLNAYIGSKQLNLSHCQSIIFSEELAYNGITDYIYNFINNLKMPHTANIVISKCNAEYYLNNSESVYEKFISKYYKTSPASGRYTGYTDSINLVKFFSSLNDTTTQPAAILSSINIPETKLSSTYDDSYLKDSTYKAGQSPITTKNTGMEDIGLAVFKDGKLVGELTAVETIAYLMTSNKFEECELTIINPLTKNSTIDFSLTKQKNTKNKVTFVNGTPFITSDISLTVNILSIDKNSDYLSNSVLSRLETDLNLYIQNLVYEYLYKTSNEYNSDISGFGRFAVAKFPNSNAWKNYNWSENYRNAFFKVNVSTIIKSSNLLLET